MTKALDKARAKAGAAHVSVDFIRADVTRLSQAGIGAEFGLIVDNGCLHNMSEGDRDEYVREVSMVAAAGWTLLSAGDEGALDRAGRAPARYYLFQRLPLPASRHVTSCDDTPYHIAMVYVSAQSRNRDYVSEAGGRKRCPYRSASSRARATKAALPVPAGPE